MHTEGNPQRSYAVMHVRRGEPAWGDEATNTYAEETSGIKLGLYITFSLCKFLVLIFPKGDFVAVKQI